MKRTLGRIVFWAWVLAALGDYARHFAASFWASKGSQVAAAAEFVRTFSLE